MPFVWTHAAAWAAAGCRLQLEARCRSSLYCAVQLDTYLLLHYHEQLQANAVAMSIRLQDSDMATASRLGLRKVTSSSN
jgi:hypothetical protein